MFSGTYDSVPLRAAPVDPLHVVPPVAGDAGGQPTPTVDVPMPVIFDRSSSINDFFFTFDMDSGNVWGLLYLLAAFAVGAMGWHYIVVVVMAWVVTHMCFCRTREKHMDTIFNLQTALQDPDTARRIMGPYLPAWLSFSQLEKTAWLQVLINNMWPSIAEATKGSVLAYVNPLLVVYRPKMLSSLKMTQCDLGTVPLVVDGVCASKSGNDSVLDVYFHWNGNSDIRIVADAMGVEVEAVICNLQYQSVLRMFLGPHCGAWPCFACFSMTFVGKPVVSFNLKAAKIPLEAIPGFGKWLEGFVEEMLSWSLTYPRRLNFPMFNDLEAMHLLENTVDPIGRLRVRVVQADGIPETFFQKRRTYVQGVRTNGDSKSAVTKRTKSVVGKNPAFQEDLVFTVYRAPNERIELSLVADEAKPPVIGNLMLRDNVIGLIMVTVDGLLEDKMTMTKRLVNAAKTSANVGTLTIETEFTRFVDPGADLGEEESGGDALSGSGSQSQPTLEEASRGRRGRSATRSSAPLASAASASSFFEAKPRRSSSAARLRRSTLSGKPIKGLLVVNIVSCANLQKVDVIGSADPYVKLRLGNFMDRTEHINDNINPLFNVQKQMDVEDVVCDVLEVEVHDYDKIKINKRLLGKVSIPIKNIFEAGCSVPPTSYQLTPKGTITLGLRLLINQEATATQS